MSVPFTTITKSNLTPKTLIQLREELFKGSFIAIDTEFSGLGPWSLTRERNLNERYKGMREVVVNNGIVSIGLSIFKLINEADKLDKKYEVENYHLLVRSERAFNMDPNSMKFLSNNGFDWNYWIQNSIPFLPTHFQTNNDKVKVSEEVKEYSSLLQDFVTMLFQSGKPIIVHNGLLDLMHLYHHFYSPLPASLETFLADLSDLVKEGGVFDTKVLADYGSREPASYLSYLFGRFEREQSVFHLSKAFPFLSIKYDTSIKQSADDSPTVKKGSLPDDDSVCNQYAKHGHCSNRECKQSHDLEKVLDNELKDSITTFDQIKNNSQFRDHLTQLAKKVFLNPSAAANPITLYRILPKQPQEHQPLPLNFNTHHSAQFDSFMTGYIFARYLHHPSFGKEYIWGEEFFNKLYIIGKDMPLKVEKIPYSNYSAGHKRKWQLVDTKEKDNESSNKK